MRPAADALHSQLRRAGGWIGGQYQKYLGRFHPAVGMAIIGGLGLLLAGLFLVLLASGVYLGLFGPLPTYGDIRNIRNNTASEVYDANGVLLGKYFVENRTNADFEEITPAIVNALVATEDARFFQHGGVDLRALGRVVIRSLLLRDESSGGGSTLSQQLAKNLYARREYWLFALPINKFREMFVARRLERTYSKEELLRLYLNTVPFGDDIFGIKVAARRYFNRRPEQLKVEEAAVLVGMLKANSYYHPVRHPARALARRNTVLQQMEKYGYLSAGAADSLAALPLQTDFQPEGHTRGSGTYFREYLRQEVEQLIAGIRKPNGNPYDLYTDGLRVYTTLDARLQQYAEEAVAEQMAGVQAAFEQDWKEHPRPWEKRGAFLSFLRETDAYQRLKAQGLSEEQVLEALRETGPVRLFDWSAATRDTLRELSVIDSLRHQLSLLHAGFLAVEPQTGLVRAWVGGIDARFFQYDHVLSRRQVGSVFKPVVYAQALRQGMLPCEYTENRQVSFADYDNWSPRNADGIYEGAYSMEGGLAHSVNTVSANILQRGGMDSTTWLARQMGFEGKLEAVPSLALGTAEGSLWDMVRVYSTLASGGKRPRLHFLDRVETAEGVVIARVERPLPRTFERVLEEEAAALIVRMLQTVVDSGTARRLRYGFGLRGPLAGKTGTTQNQSDGWFMGCTPRLVAGAWVGAESPLVHFRTLAAGQGASTALPIWGRFLQKVQTDRHTRPWTAGTFPSPSDSMLAYMDCPLYLEELPIMADFWPDYEENPGFFNRWYRESARSDSRYNIRLRPRRKDETDMEYYLRMQEYNERLLRKEERRQRRREFWGRILFGRENEKDEQ